MAVIFFEATSTAPDQRHALVTRAASRTAVLIANAAGFGLAFVASYLLFVRTDAGRGVENGVVHSAQSMSTMDWALPLRQVDLVVVLGAVAVLLVVVALVRRRWVTGPAGALRSAGADRARPGRVRGARHGYLGARAVRRRAGAGGGVGAARRAAGGDAAAAGELRAGGAAAPAGAEPLTRPVSGDWPATPVGSPP